MKNFKPPNFVTIAVLTAITVAFWIFFGVFRIFTKTDEKTVPAEILAPLSPTLDKNVLDKLPTRVYFDDSQIPETMFTSPTPTVVQRVVIAPTTTPVATASGTPTETITPTEGAVVQ